MRTVVGLFNRIEEAQGAIKMLRDAGFNREDINLIARDAKGEYSRHVESTKQGENQDIREGAAAGAGVGAVIGGLGGLLLGLGALAIPGIGPVLAAGPIASTLIGAGAGAVTGGIVGSLVDLGIPKEHAEAYAEGIRRGGTLVTVRTPDDRSDDAVQILEHFNPLDINQQVQTWRSTNWQGFDEQAGPYEMDEMETSLRENIPVTGSDRGMDIPVIEEELNVGKRTVDTGGVRIKSDIREEPYEEDVELRHERVNVERRPVNRDATDEDLNAFKEGSMEFKESEEQVIAEKRRKVVEEVHVDKDIETETETVRDTLRKQDVNVERTDADEFQGFDRDFRSHFDRYYAAQGMEYNDVMPAYRYGYSLARDRRFQDYDWDGIEPEARVAWERRYGQNTWDRIRDAVRHAWEGARR